MKRIGYAIATVILLLTEVLIALYVHDAFVRPYDIIYSYMKYTNVGSYSTALANGMKKVKEYQDPKNTISYVYAITREEWKKMKEN